MSVAEKMDRYVQEFSEFYDNFDRLTYLISLSSEMPLPDDDLCIKENQVHGCESEVWIKMSTDEQGKVHMQAFSDTLLVRGVLCIFADVVDGAEPSELPLLTMDFLDQCQIPSALKGRRGGLAKAIKVIQSFS